MTRRSWVQVNGVLYEKGMEPIPEPKSALIMPDIQPFQSPINGEVISGRGKLRRHMKEHEVTRAEDYSPQWRERADKERKQRLLCSSKEDRKDRIEALKYALEKHHGR